MLKQLTDLVLIGAIKCFAVIVNVIYQICYRLTSRHDLIVFISRTGAGMSEDFQLMQTFMATTDLAGIKIAHISMLDGENLHSRLKLLRLSFKSLPLLARCRLCVLDSYWPTVSLLYHKHFKVIQLWHSVGKVKQSGYQTLGRTSGRSLLAAQYLRMHKNYDAVIAGSEFWTPYYCASFGIEADIIKNFGLPRLDAIYNGGQAYRQMIEANYPDLLTKPVVLYAPTFRKNYEFDFLQFLPAVATDHFNIVIKTHPKTMLSLHSLRAEVQSGLRTCPQVSTRAVMSICDYMITDYSSIGFEAAILSKKILFFIPDYQLYLQNNGVNIDILQLFPELCAQTVEELQTRLSEPYNYAALMRFKTQFLPKQLGDSTLNVVNLMRTLYNETV